MALQVKTAWLNTGLANRSTPIVTPANETTVRQMAATLKSKRRDVWQHAPELMLYDSSMGDGAELAQAMEWILEEWLDADTPDDALRRIALSCVHGLSDDPGEVTQARQRVSECVKESGVDFHPDWLSHKLRKGYSYSGFSASDLYRLPLSRDLLPVRQQLIVATLQAWSWDKAKRALAALHAPRIAYDSKGIAKLQRNLTWAMEPIRGLALLWQAAMFSYSRKAAHQYLAGLHTLSSDVCGFLSVISEPPYSALINTFGGSLCQDIEFPNLDCFQIRRG